MLVQTDKMLKIRMSNNETISRLQDFLDNPEKAVKYITDQDVMHLSDTVEKESIPYFRQSLDLLLFNIRSIKNPNTQRSSAMSLEYIGFFDRKMLESNRVVSS